MWKNGIEFCLRGEMTGCGCVERISLIWENGTLRQKRRTEVAVSPCQQQNGPRSGPALRFDCASLVCVIYECHPLTRTVKAMRLEALLDGMVNLPPRRHGQHLYVLAIRHGCLFSFLSNQAI